MGAAYRFYCDKELVDAHSAMADATATYEILKAQLDKYDDLENDVNFLEVFSHHKKNADFAGMIVFDKDGDEVFNFGKQMVKKEQKSLKKKRVIMIGLKMPMFRFLQRKF